MTSSSGDVCETNKKYIDKAQEYFVKKDYRTSLELAAEVQNDSKCQLDYLRAMKIIAEIHIFKAPNKDFEAGIQAAKKGLAEDQRQTLLWFFQGYAQYQINSYEEAMTSLRQVLTYYKIYGVEEELLMQTRYLIADSADRNVGDLNDANKAENQRLLRDAIREWQNFEDFCMDVDCPDTYLERAPERIEDLKQKLAMQMIDR